MAAVGVFDWDADPATACTACPRCAVGECPPGTAWVHGGSIPTEPPCRACAGGAADIDGDPHTPCEACGPGTTATVGEFGATGCQPCPPGLVDHDGNPLSACRLCPAGTVPATPPPAATGDSAGANAAAATAAANCTACPTGTTTAAQPDVWGLLARPGRDECRPSHSAAQYAVVAVCAVAGLAFCGCGLVRCCRRRRLLAYRADEQQQQRGAAGRLEPPRWLPAYWLLRKVDKAVLAAEQAKVGAPRPVTAAATAAAAGGPYLGRARLDGRSVVVDAHGTRKPIGGEAPDPAAEAARRQKLRALHERACGEAETVAAWAAASSHAVFGEDRRQVAVALAATRSSPRLPPLPPPPRTGAVASPTGPQLERQVFFKARRAAESDPRQSPAKLAAATAAAAAMRTAENADPKEERRLLLADLAAAAAPASLAASPAEPGGHCLLWDAGGGGGGPNNSNRRGAKSQLAHLADSFAAATSR